LVLMFPSCVDIVSIMFFEFCCVVMCIWLSTAPFLIYANIANITMLKTLIQIQCKMFLK
jgi:hypothetical protein